MFSNVNKSLSWLPVQNFKNVQTPTVIYGGCQGLMVLCWNGSVPQRCKRQKNPHCNNSLKYITDSFTPSYHWNCFSVFYWSRTGWIRDQQLINQWWHICFIRTWSRSVSVRLTLFCNGTEAPTVRSVSWSVSTYFGSVLVGSCYNNIMKITAEIVYMTNSGHHKQCGWKSLVVGTFQLTHDFCVSVCLNGAEFMLRYLHMYALGMFLLRKWSFSVRICIFCGPQILSHTILNFPHLNKIVFVFSKTQRCHHSLENNFSCVLTTERRQMNTTCFIIQWQMRPSSVVQHLCIWDIWSKSPFNKHIRKSKCIWSHTT